MRASSLLVLLLVSCGPSEAPPPTTAVAVKPSATVPTQKPIVEDRTPVDAPTGLVMQGHAIALRSIVRSVRAYLPSSAPALDPRKIVGSLGDGTFDRIIDVDKPADIAMVIPEQGKSGKPPMPHIGFAFGVEDNADVAGALKNSYRVEVRAGGVLELIPNGATSGGHCVIAPSLGVAKHRLICAVEGDVMQLAPWLSRGVTQKQEPTTPIHVEVDAARIKKVYATEIEKVRAVARGEIASEIKTGFQEIDRVLKGWAKSGVDEAFDLLEDLDRLTLDVALPNEGVQPSLGFTFASTKSWTARMMLAGGDMPAGTSKSLAKLPSDSVWLAGFSRATPQSDTLIAPIQTALKDLIDAAATEFKWPKGDRDLALEVVKTMFPAAADMAFVSGNAGKVELPENTPKAYGIGRSLADAFLNKTYSVSVVERDAKAPIALAKAFAAWAVKPSVIETYRKITHDRMTAKINVKPGSTKDMPKGSFAQRYELELGINPNPDDKKAKPKVDWIAKLSTESIIVPDTNARTYVGFAQNMGDGDLWKRMQGAIAGTGSPISSYPGYGFITEQNGTVGMMMTTEGSVKMADRKNKKAAEILPQLPDGGRSSLAFRFTASKPPKATAEVAAHIPRDMISAGYLFFARK
jgi:hypothetical protein